MLQASLGVVADAESRQGFIDFDSVPKETAPVSEVVSFLLSDSASKLRPLLNAEMAYGLDLALRRTARRLRGQLRELLAPRVPLLGLRLQPPVPPLLLPVPRDLEKTGPATRLKGAEDILNPVKEIHTSYALQNDLKSLEDSQTIYID